MSGETPASARRLDVRPDVQAVAEAAADLFVARAKAVQQSGRDFRVALSGGSTPRRFHALLAASPRREQVDWARIQFFWGDERTVPPDDPESNFGMARETLLDRVPVRPEQIHRMRGEDEPEQAAQAYSAEIRRVFGESGEQTPRFDLIFVGMGPDGHTLSLFPHTEALHVTDKLVVANVVPQQHTTRITFTQTLANAAALVAFLVAGADKAPALAAVLEGPPDPEQYPSQLIAPTSGEALFIVDEAAAAQLSSRR